MVRKSHILVVCFVLTLSFLIYSIKDYNTTPTIVLPVTNKVIVLDPGHGGPDPGAIGGSGTLEKDVNLDITLKLQAFLEQGGCVVQLTRAIDEATHDTEKFRKLSDLKNRKKVISESEANAFVSIHLNSFPEAKYKGVQSFYPRESETSKKLAECIQGQLKSILQISDNRDALPIKDVYIMKNVKIPSAIVECGFLSNPEEEKSLASDAYRNKIAWGIYLGIMKFFEGAQ
jgi:N-acetylmuramoyl-L-alanine amidase